MREVGAYQAKTHLPELLEQVMHGETILITKRGVPAAILSSPATNKAAVYAAVANLRAMRDAITWDKDFSTAAAIKAGRR